jgi:hypothetical protein
VADGGIAAMARMAATRLTTSKMAVANLMVLTTTPHHRRVMHSRSSRPPPSLLPQPQLRPNRLRLNDAVFANRHRSQGLRRMPRHRHPSYPAPAAKNRPLPSAVGGGGGCSATNKTALRI